MADRNPNNNNGSLSQQQQLDTSPGSNIGLHMSPSSNLMIVGGGQISDKDNNHETLEGATSSGKKKVTSVPPITTSNKPTSVEDFEILSKLGDGAYSSVYRVKRIADGEEYALKKVKLHHLSDKEKENAINEVRILASLKNPNIIQYKEAFVETQTQSLCIVMEYADNGDLFQKITEHQKNKTTFNEQDIWKIFIQVVRGLKAMHDLNIMHRDLKSANVFLYKDFTAKLGDMNVSKVANKRGLNYTQTGTPYYASPEVWRDEPYDIKSDIWSLGCVVYEMISLKPPFTAEDMQGLYKKVLKGHFPRIPKTYSHDLWTMCKTLIQVTPSSRPNCEQIMSFPTFSKKFEKYFPEDHQIYQNEQQNILLKTIKFPKNLMYLSDRLPKQNYKNHSHHYSINVSLDDNQNTSAHYASLDMSSIIQNAANHRQSRKNIHAVQLVQSLQVGGNGGSSSVIQQKNNIPQQQQQPKELRLPSIQNMKQQQYLNQINQPTRAYNADLAVPMDDHQYIMQQQQQQSYKKRSVVSLANNNNPQQMDLLSPSPQQMRQNGIQKPIRNASKRYIQHEDDSQNTHQSSSALGDDTIVDLQQQQHPGTQRSRVNQHNKKNSVQFNNINLEVLSEEGGQPKEGSGGTTNEKNRRASEEYFEGSTSKGLKKSPSEKRYKINSDGSMNILPPLNIGNGSQEQDRQSLDSSRHASPTLIRNQNSMSPKKIKLTNHMVSISQDYSQKRLVPGVAGNYSHINQSQSNAAATIQRVAGIYNVHNSMVQKPMFIGNNAQQQQSPYMAPQQPSRLSPTYIDNSNMFIENQLDSNGINTDRMRISPQRVNDLVSRYNLGGLKKTLNKGAVSIGPINKYKKNSSRANGNQSNVSSNGVKLNYSIGGPISNIGDSTIRLQDNASQQEIFMPLQNQPSTNILQNQQRVVLAIQNAAKGRKTRNNSKSIVQSNLVGAPVQMVQSHIHSQSIVMDNDQSVAAMIAATQRFTNKTTVEQELVNASLIKTLNPKGGNNNYGPSNMILPSIDANKLTLVGSSVNDYHSGNVSPQKINLNRMTNQVGGGNGQSPRGGKKTQRQMVPGYPYLQLLPRANNKNSYDNYSSVLQQQQNNNNINATTNATTTDNLSVND